MKQILAVDNARALVTMGEPPKCREVDKIVPQNYDKDTFPHACLVEGDEVLTLRRQDMGRRNFLHTSNILGENGGLY